MDVHELNSEMLELVNTYCKGGILPKNAVENIFGKVAEYLKENHYRNLHLTTLEVLANSRYDFRCNTNLEFVEKDHSYTYKKWVKDFISLMKKSKDYTLDYLFQILSVCLYGKTPRQYCDLLHHRNKDEGWCYIPYSTSSFVDVVKSRMRKVKKTASKLTFLDVGCGIGDKVFLAHAYFDMNAYGIEYDGSLVNIAENSLGRPHYDGAAKVLHEDAFDPKVFKYEWANFIYLYCPIHNDEKMWKLINHIYDNVKPGTIIFDVCPVYIRSDLAKRSLPNFKYDNYGMYIIKE